MTKHIIFSFVILLILFVSIGNVGEAYAQSDTTKKESTSSYIPSKSPTTALWRSLALPGLGQLYVESYWKAPIFFVATGTLVYLIIDNQVNFADYDKRLQGMSKTDINYNLTKSYREFYRDNRDMSGFYLMGVYILAAVDAYVGAHLYDFQVDDNLAIGMKLSSSPVPAINFVVKF